MCTVGDFNAHNSDWIHSVSDTDKAGELMQEFVQLNGMLQLVDFPTREGNTLDLIMTDFEGTTTAAAHIGTSDHVSIIFEIQVLMQVPEAASQSDSVNWRKAPWDHIRGDVKRAVSEWIPNFAQSVSEVQTELDDLLWKVVKRHVKLRAPTKPRPLP